MNLLRGYLLKNTLFLLGVAAGLIAVYKPLFTILQSNLFMNISIIGLLVIGIIYTFSQLFLLKREQKWFSVYEQGRHKFPGVKHPFLLTPFLMVRDIPSLSVLNRQSILNSVDVRLDELRSVTRYLIGLLIFLGLLGTFWGLSQTIGAIAGVVANLDVGVNEVKEAFHILKQGLQSPLQGMGTAFSSSMFGLGSSLILGFLDLQVGRACQNFYQEIEEKMLQATFHNADKEMSTHHGAAYSQAMMEQAAENLNAVVEALHQQQDNRISLVKIVQQLTEKLSHVTDIVGIQTKQLEIMKQNNEHTYHALEYIVKQVERTNASLLTEKLGNYLASMDSTLVHLLEESIKGRQQLVHEVRAEIRMVAKTISALASEQDER